MVQHLKALVLLKIKLNTIKMANRRRQLLGGAATLLLIVSIFLPYATTAAAESNLSLSISLSLKVMIFIIFEDFFFFFLFNDRHNVPHSKSELVSNPGLEEF